ncbi:13080_t:CDS:10 [Funneliformis caledonium]|uniref:Cytochrome b n=1 Tax=Funneliformis caledonium TaxID=1117310 RepID=A0A9N9ET99_9GLOM|nr:13080_t:CDS:10 [Funneliformis caledonium]
MSFWAEPYDWPTCLCLPICNPHTRALRRIGPHNYDVLSLIMGSMLGDSNAERHGNGTRIRLQQESSNVEYLRWFHKFLASRGYCSTTKPKLHIRTEKGGKGIKVVPLNIGDYISPLALAVWIMDYATALPYGMKITTNSFCYKDVLFLCEVLREKYGIVARPNKDGDQWVLYIHSESMSNLSKIVKPYMVPSMHYKLGDAGVNGQRSLSPIPRPALRNSFVLGKNNVLCFAYLLKTKWLDLVEFVWGGFSVITAAYNNNMKTLLDAGITPIYGTRSTAPQRLNAKDMAWLVGFLEGDGWFSITKNGIYCKYEFGIEVSEKDIKLLYKLKEMLGVALGLYYLRNNLLNNVTYIYNLKSYARPDHTPFETIDLILACTYFDNWLVGFQVKDLFQFINLQVRPIRVSVFKPLVLEAGLQNVIHFLDRAEAKLKGYKRLQYLLFFKEIRVNARYSHLDIPSNYALHQHGSNNPLGVTSSLDRVPFYPYYVFKDLVGFFVFFLVLAFFVFFAPNAMGHPDNSIAANPMQTPISIVPEFYLLPFYAILRAIPQKLLGVVAMLGAILILLALPFLETSRIRSCAFRPFMRLAFWSFVTNFFLLMWIGSQHPEVPYIFLGQICSRSYTTLSEYLPDKIDNTQTVNELSRANAWLTENLPFLWKTFPKIWVNGFRIY